MPPSWTWMPIDARDNMDMVYSGSTQVPFYILGKQTCLITGCFFVYADILRYNLISYWHGPCHQHQTMDGALPCTRMTHSTLLHDAKTCAHVRRINNEKTLPWQSFSPSKRVARVFTLSPTLRGGMLAQLVQTVSTITNGLQYRISATRTI